MSQLLTTQKTASHHRGATHFNIHLDSFGTVAKVAVILEGKKGDKNRPIQSAHITPPEAAPQQIECDDPIALGCLACGKEEGTCGTCVNNPDLSIDFAVAQVLAEVAVIIPEFKDIEETDPLEPRALLFPKNSIERAAFLGKMPKLEVLRHEEK